MTVRDYAQPIPYTNMGKNFLRPCLHVSVEDMHSKGRATGLVPMIVDTGSDLCIFSVHLAHSIGVNPLDGGEDQLQDMWVAGGGKFTTAAWPVSIHVPQLGHRFDLSARFGQFNEGTNGVLGHQGFLKWMSIRFDYAESFCVEQIRSAEGKNHRGETVTLGGIPL